MENSPERPVVKRRCFKEGSADLAGTPGSFSTPSAGCDKRSFIDTPPGLEQMSKDRSHPKRASKVAKRRKEPSDRSASLTQQAYEAIKEKVITLYFLPGQYLNEAAICDLLQLGRTPVHQALQRLQLEGLIDVVPRKGVIIQPDSIGQIAEFLDARLVVEPEIARLAAAHAATKNIEELQTILDNGFARNGGGEINAFVECDHAFHKKISEMSGSRVLGDFTRSLHERCTRAWYLHLWQTLDTAASDKQHRAILKAIRNRDGDAAARAMRAHLSSLRERVLRVQHSAPRAGAPMQFRSGPLKDLA